jgi:hypothetical protein
MPKRRGSRPTESKDDPYQCVDAAADAASTLRGRRSVEYDGVLGRPPDCFPRSDQDSFLTARNRLLDNGGFEERGYNPEELHRFIDKVIEEDEASIRHPGTALNRNTFMVPPADRRDIYTLAHLWTAYQLGPEKCLGALAGKDAVSGYRSRMAHQKRDDHVEKQVVQKIGLKLWRKDRGLPIAEIERAPEMRIYKRKYKGRHTLRDWLNEIDPHPELRKPGRRPHQ